MSMRDALGRLFQSGAVWAADGGVADAEHLSFLKIAEDAGRGGAAPFFIPAIDDELADGGLGFGKVHEWLAPAGVRGRKNQPLESLYPLTVLSVVIGNGFQHTGESSRLTLWIGKECWPTPHLLERALSRASGEGSGVLSRCLFIDLPEQEKRKWCFEQALRSPAVGAAVCSLKKTSLALTRRFAVAARRGGTLGMLLRPAADARAASASASRWEVKSVLSASEFPRWSVTLLKQKGRCAKVNSWIIELAESSLSDNAMRLSIPVDVEVRSNEEGSRELKSRDKVA